MSARRISAVLTDVARARADVVVAQRSCIIAQIRAEATVNKLSELLVELQRNLEAAARSPHRVSMPPES
jgi:hypothetical protein